MVIDFLETFKTIARCNHVTLTVFQNDAAHMDELPDFDMGIRRLLLRPDEIRWFYNQICPSPNDRAVSYVTDYFETEYCVVPIPEAEKTYGGFLLLGPYMSTLIHETKLPALMEEKSIPIDFLGELREYYHAVPILAGVDQWRELCLNMAQTLYNGQPLPTRCANIREMAYGFQNEISHDVLSYQMIEERYNAEREMLMAISSGNTEEALKYLTIVENYKLTSRYKDPIRDLRNGLITANTLWRKAAEAGCVHPAHLDSLSTQMAKRVETINSSSEAYRFLAVMLRKYCLLVRNYSLQGCSPVIQKVVNRINLNLSSDLSLKHLASEYSVNASYLSSLFKKEMNITITDYINQQRVRRAITLLNSTNMQIQDIASESGIFDVNYFRKVFKKHTGMTPTEYAQQICHPRAKK